MAAVASVEFRLPGLVLDQTTHRESVIGAHTNPSPHADSSSSSSSNSNISHNNSPVITPGGDKPPKPIFIQSVIDSQRSARSSLVQFNSRRLTSLLQVPLNSPWQTPRPSHSPNSLLSSSQPPSPPELIAMAQSKVPLLNLVTTNLGPDGSQEASPTITILSQDSENLPPATNILQMMSGKKPTATPPPCSSRFKHKGTEGSNAAVVTNGSSADSHGSSHRYQKPGNEEPRPSILARTDDLQRTNPVHTTGVQPPIPDSMCPDESSPPIQTISVKKIMSPSTNANPGIVIARSMSTIPEEQILSSNASDTCLGAKQEDTRVHATNAWVPSPNIRAGHCRNLPGISKVAIVASVAMVVGGIAYVILRFGFQIGTD